MKTNSKFNYGKYIIEYRLTKNEPISFLRKKIDNVELAMQESDKLKNKGCHDVLIRTNNQ